MATRDLISEQKNVDAFIKAQGKLPSTDADWRVVHSATYGAELPADLANLPMYKASSNPDANTSAPKPVMFQGSDVGDSAIASATSAYNAAAPVSSLVDKVRSRLKEKFQPETATLGLGAYAATLGALDPNGVMAGIDEQTNKFRRNGALALQALSTANDIYSEQAKLTLDNLTSLETKRAAYEKEQKDTEGQMEDLALTVAKTGQPIPDAMLALLPPAKRDIYKGMSSVFAADNARTSAKSGGSGSGSGGSGTTPEPVVSYNDFLKAMGDKLQMSLDPNAQEWKDAYDEYKASNPTSAQDVKALQKLLTTADKQKMYASGLDYNNANDIDEYLKTKIIKGDTAGTATPAETNYSSLMP